MILRRPVPSAGGRHATANCAASGRPRVVVTGAAGFIGRTLVSTLLHHGYRVAALTRRPSTLPGAEVRVTGELERARGLEAVLAGAGTVVHLAGRAEVDRQDARTALLQMRLANAETAMRMARQAADAGVRRLVFLSSVKVHGECTAGQPFSEADPLQPVGPYAVSKGEAEDHLHREAARSGMEVVIIRSPLVYGAGVKGNFLRLLRLVEMGGVLPLGAIANRRSLVGLPNLVDLILACMEHPAAAGRAFLASDGEDLSTPELIRALAAAMNRPARLLPVPVALLRPLLEWCAGAGAFNRLCGSLQVDISRARQLLGWHPRFRLADGLRETAAWYRRQG